MNDLTSEDSTFDDLTSEDSIFDDLSPEDEYIREMFDVSDEMYGGGLMTSNHIVFMLKIWRDSPIRPHLVKLYLDKILSYIDGIEDVDKTYIPKVTSSS